jgi:hypothetical protein
MCMKLGLDKIPRYVNLAFEIEFPYIRVANERISTFITTGQVECMFHNIQNLPGPMYSKKQRLAQQFDVCQPGSHRGDTSNSCLTKKGILAWNEEVIMLLLHKCKSIIITSSFGVLFL